MEIRPLQTANGLDKFLQQQPLQPFLQSWAWGDFQSAIGRKIWRFGAYKANRLVGSALVIEHELIMGQRYLYCPRGPLAATSEAWLDLLQAMAELGRKEGAMYIKVDPNAMPFDILAWPSGWTAGTALQPPATMIIDLTSSPEECLARMHQKTRYNIRLAEKHGVIVSWSTEQDDLNIFFDVLFKTYERQGIRPHPRKYYQELFSTLKAASMVELAVARYEGQPLAVNMVIWHGRTATYLHGGSADSGKEHMAPHLLQWATILEAKRRGCTSYDLWGLSSTKVGRIDKGGVARFKQGFGGTLLQFPSPKNFVLDQNWYWAYRLAKRFRGGVDD